MQPQNATATTPASLLSWHAEYGLIAIAVGFVVLAALFAAFARYRFYALYDREAAADPTVSPRQVFAAQILYNRSRITLSVLILMAFVVSLGVMFKVGAGGPAHDPYRSTDVDDH